MYFSECAKVGINVVENAVLMRPVDFEYISMRMFETDQHSARTMFVVDVQFTGRISEVDLEGIPEMKVLLF